MYSYPTTPPHHTESMTIQSEGLPIGHMPETEKRAMDDTNPRFKPDPEFGSGFGSENGDNLEFGPGEETRLVRRLDMCVLPLVMLLYLFSFLDRVNIGNARLYHLESDLGMSSTQFSTAISVLFATYLASEVPSNLLLKRLRPSRWIGFIAISWGIVASSMGATQSYGGLLVCRVILGIFEGGLFPGLTLYLTLFYSKRELALRIGYLFVAAALAGAFGGLLAFAIGLLDGRHGISGWRWIFIIEGLPTIVLGIITFFVLADEPRTAFFLSDRQRKLTTVRLGQQQGHTSSAGEFHWADVRLALMDWTVWAFGLALFGADTMLYGFSTFLPTIIRAIKPDVSKEVIQVLTIPCYALGAIVYLTVAWVSDKYQIRSPFVLASGLVSVLGYALLMSPVTAGVRYLGCFFVAAGLYVFVGLPLAWLPSNCPRYGKRATATGIQLMFGNCAGIMSSFLYPTDEAPRFVRGHAVTLGMIVFAIVVYVVLAIHFWNQNRVRREMLVNAGLVTDDGKAVVKTGESSIRSPITSSGPSSPENPFASIDPSVLRLEHEMAELGDRSPWFVYTY